MIGPAAPPAPGDDARHRALFEAIDQGVIYVEPATGVVDANPAARRILGLTLEQMRNHVAIDPGWRCIREDGSDFPVAERPAQVALRTGRDVRNVVFGVVVGADAAPRWVNVNALVRSGAQGEAPTVLVTFDDITERKRSEDASREVAQRLEFALRAGRLGVWDWNVRTSGMVWDDQMLGLYGLTREQFDGSIQAWTDGLHPGDRERATAECQAALAGVRPFDTEFRVVQPGGEVKHLKAHGLVLRDERGAPLRMLGVNQDFTAHRRAEENYQTLFQEMLDGFALHEIICDAQGRPVDYRFLAVNPAFERMTGLQVAQVVGRTVLEVMPLVEPDWIERYGKVALTGEPCLFESQADALGKTFEVKAFSPAPLQFACIFTDITERRRAETERAKLEHQLRQAQKMESVGRLAGGVAHDFNNMLGAILGHAELAMDQLAPGQPAYEDLVGVQAAARRSADLTRQLLAFARRQTVAPRVLDLNETIAGMLKMLQRLIGEGIHLRWLPEADLWPINLDPSQIDQVLANLCVNARDAIAGVGTLTIETSNVSFDAEYCEVHPGYLPGDYLCLAVSDDGCGMDQETQALIFEPFFTTKELGRGTGLGLSTVYGIVKQNQGLLTVYSELGKGTTFNIYLPRHATAPKADEAPARPPPPRGQETILVVEDEPAILAITVRMLERLGYTVLSATSPGLALQLASERTTPIDLLITDVVMPEMSGRDLALRLHPIQPWLRRLYMSGYPANVIAHQGVLDEGVDFIPKPFSSGDLAFKVREALASAPLVHG
jgi:PAS domain S-box-containing protein